MREFAEPELLFFGDLKSMNCLPAPVSIRESSSMVWSSSISERGIHMDCLVVFTNITFLTIALHDLDIDLNCAFKNPPPSHLSGPPSAHWSLKGL